MTRAWTLPNYTQPVSRQAKYPMHKLQNMNVYELIELRKEMLRMHWWCSQQNEVDRKRAWYSHQITRIGELLNYRLNTTKYIPR